MKVFKKIKGILDIIHIPSINHNLPIPKGHMELTICSRVFVVMLAVRKTEICRIVLGRGSQNFEIV